MEAQLRAIRDIEEKQTAIQDIISWTAKQKEQDQFLSKSNARAKRNGNHSAPSSILTRDVEKRTEETSSFESRSKQTQKHNSKEVKPVQQPSSNTSTDYARWENFDIDAALAECSDSEKDSIDLIEHSTANGPPKLLEERVAGPADLKAKHSVRRNPKASRQEAAISKPQQKGDFEEAEYKRHQGNEAYKQGDLVAAKAAYTRSIQVLPSAAAYANRAMVHLKHNNYAAAEADSTMATILDPAFLKAWQRRGTARREQGQLLKAAQDFEEALRLEPTSKALQADKQACIAAWREQTQTSRSAAKRLRIPVKQAEHSGKAAAPTLKGTPLQSAQQSVGDADAEAPLESKSKAPEVVPEHAMSKSAGFEGAAEAAEAPKSSMPTQQNAITQERAMTSTNSREQDLSSRFSAGTASNPSINQTMVHPAGKSSNPPAKNSKAGPMATPEPSNSVPAMDSKVVEQLASLGVISNQRKAQPVLQAEASNGVGATQTAALRERSLALRKRPPKSGIEFETVWRSLKEDTATQAQYLRLLDPVTLPRLFKQSLTGPLLASIVAAILSDQDPGSSDHSRAVLEGLQQVPRFAMAAMSFSKAEHTTLAQLWDQQIEEPKGAISTLRAAYGV